MSEKVNIDPLFKNYMVFPWDIMGLTVPMVGSLTAYLSKITAQYGNHNEQLFLTGFPSLRSLEAFYKKDTENMLAAQIHSYASRKEAARQSERACVADEVLSFLRNYPPFVNAMQKKFDSLYRQGLILIPEECKPKPPAPVEKTQAKDWMY